MSTDQKDDKIPAVFRKTKSDKWAVMAPVADLEKALTEGGKVDVLKKSGDWSTFRIVSLGRPFDVDGVEMCYGYADDGETADGGSGGSGEQSRRPTGRGSTQVPSGRQPKPPPRDESEPMPEFQGGPEDEWSEF